MMVDFFNNKLQTLKEKQKDINDQKSLMHLKAETRKIILDEFRKLKK